eukprot:3491445-Pyramimonas_sp.AAC.1
MRYPLAAPPWGRLNPRLARDILRIPPALWAPSGKSLLFPPTWTERPARCQRWQDDLQDVRVPGGTCSRKMAPRGHQIAQDDLQDGST